MFYFFLFTFTFHNKIEYVQLKVPIVEQLLVNVADQTYPA